MNEKYKKIAEYILAAFICIVMTFFTVGAVGGVRYLADKRDNKTQTAYADTVDETYTSSVFVVPYFDLFTMTDQGIDLTAFPYFQVKFRADGIIRTFDFSLSKHYYQSGKFNFTQPFVNTPYTVRNKNIVYDIDDEMWCYDFTDLLEEDIYYFYKYYGPDFSELYVNHILIHGNIQNTVSVVPVAYSEGLRLIDYPNNVPYYGQSTHLVYSYRFYFNNYQDYGSRSYHEFNIVSIDFPVEESYFPGGSYTGLDINSAHNYIPPMRRYVLSASGENQEAFNLGLQEGEEKGIEIGKSIGRTDYIANELPSVVANARREGYNEGVEESGNYSFRSLLNAVFYAPLHALASMFNFEVLGVNLLNVVTALFALLLISIILKFILGGF